MKDNDKKIVLTKRRLYVAQFCTDLAHNEESPRELLGRVQKTHNAKCFDCKYREKKKRNKERYKSRENEKNP